MALEWRLRKVLADNGVWSGAELSRLLEDKAGYKLSPPSISALLGNEPKQVKTSTMDALCTALNCTPNDLWKHTPTYVRKVERPNMGQGIRVANELGRGNKLPPI